MTAFKGTSGDDSLTGTASADTFDLIQGGEDSATGLGGNDTFSLGRTLDAGDTIDGGTGHDQLFLRGDYSDGVTFGATTVTNVERLALGAGFNYRLTTNDATVAANLCSESSFMATSTSGWEMRGVPMRSCDNVTWQCALPLRISGP